MNKIEVYGHEISYTLSVMVAGYAWNDILLEIKDNVKWQIEDGQKEGLIELYYTDENEEDQIDVDVDVKWWIVDWKYVAKELYDALQSSNPHSEEQRHKKNARIRYYKECLNNMP